MTRHEKLCETMTQLCEELSEQGRTMGRVSTTQVVEACRLDASYREIEEALHVVGEQYENEADALELYFRECAAGHACIRNTS